MVRQWAKSCWKLKGCLEVSAMPGGLFLFKFNTDEDLMYVLLGSWAYGKHFLTMDKWKPSFDPSTELNRMAPVWVRLLGLPLEFWDEQIFRWIGNSFGSFVAADLITLNKSRLVYACFCVNVTLNKALPNFISLKSKYGKWTQAIVYENATLYCQKCNKQGHSYTDCKAPIAAEPKIKNKAIWAEPINLGDPSSSTPFELTTVNEISKDYPHKDKILEILKSPVDPIKNSNIPLEEGEILEVIALNMASTKLLLIENSLPTSPTPPSPITGDRDVHPGNSLVTLLKVSPPVSPRMDNEEWITQKKKVKAKKEDVGGNENKVGRPSERVLRHKVMARDIAKGKQLTLDGLSKRKK
ncbi:uncharacterized protein LOC131856394 [Cryptomeria japonica]|uniref:uncharacterized protein LOC131856394 n=1 Tax=Cryptomeria japonica TaxID=3369 RepID=UPI0027DA1010|nr:uncharacterized protein LOC131856394 [Cryptomeria japonica]